MLIGLDIGTTGVKAVVFDDCATVLSSAYEEYAIVSASDGKAEQDAQDVWKRSRMVLLRAIASGGVKSVEAIGLSVQGDAIICIDRSGNPLRPTLLGMDYRSAPSALAFADAFGERNLYERTGMRSHAMNSITKIRYVREAYPEVFAKTYKFVTYAEFIAMKLCGECVLDATMASRTMAFELHTQQWDEQLLDFAGISKSQLGTIQESGTVIGQLASDIVREAGLQGRPLVCTGGHDQCCAALGAGVVEPSLGVVSTGTAEVISTCLPAILTNDGMFDSYFPCYRHVLRNTYFTFSLNHVGGILLRWFKDTFCAKEIQQAQRMGLGIYQYLDSIMAPSPQELFILPHFNGSGTPYCDMDATGAILGLSLSTGVPELYRALLESQTYELALNLEAFAKSGISIQTLSAVGGGAKSSEWVQIKANILNRPVRVPVCSESASLGAAILAGSAVGVWKDAREGADHMVGFHKEYEPQSDMTRLYGDLLAHYKEIYPALRKLREGK